MCQLTNPTPPIPLKKVIEAIKYDPLETSAVEWKQQHIATAHPPQAFAPVEDEVPPDRLKLPNITISNLSTMPTQCHCINYNKYAVLPQRQSSDATK